MWVLSTFGELRPHMQQSNAVPVLQLLSLRALEPVCRSYRVLPQVPNDAMKIPCAVIKIQCNQINSFKRVR